MYYRTKVDKLRTRLSAIPLVTRIDPGTNCPTNRGVNTVFPSIHPKRLDRPLDSFISPPRATTKPAWLPTFTDQLLSRTSIRSSRGRSTSPSSLNDQLLFNCTCQAISLLPFPSNNLWRHFCIRNARTYPSTKTYTSYREYLMCLQKLRFYPLAFYFFFFLSLSRVCAKKGVPGWYRLWPHASFHSQHRGNVYFGQVTPLCFKTFKHFVFLSIFSSVVGSRTFVHPRNPHPFSLFPKNESQFTRRYE